MAHKEHRYTPEFLKFDQELDSHLLDTQRRLRDGTFEFGPYRRHWVYVPKKRLVMALPPESRIVQWALYKLLNPFYDRMMIEDSYACREKKGSLKAAHRLQYFLRAAESKHKEYAIIKADISKFFYRVNHDVLKRILRERIEDEKILKILDDIIDSTGYRFGLPRFTNPDEIPFDEWRDDVGIPIGNLTSQLFANVYLDKLDQYCKHVLHVRYYIRYMDDVIMIVPKSEASSILDQVADFLEEALKLDMNRKTSIRKLGKVEFVGYMVSTRELTLRRKTTRRIKRAVRGICRRYFTGDLAQEDFSRRIETYKGMLVHCKADGLRERLNEIYLKEKRRSRNVTDGDNGETVYNPDGSDRACMRTGEADRAD